MRDEEILEILHSTRTIAAVGLSANPTKVSNAVASYLQSQGYRIIPVNPGAEEILGQKAYPDLAAIPGPVDLVQVFRPSPEVPPIARQAVTKGAKVLWMQEGVSSLEAKAIAEQGGLQVVMDHCLRVEHLRLIGSPRGSPRKDPMARA